MVSVTGFDNGMVQAEQDMDIRKGTEMDDRPFVSFVEVKALQDAGKGVQLRRYGVVMRAPDGKGNPGMGGVVTMPAEKFQKWFGQGYRATRSVEDHELYEHPAPPPPSRWLPSMVEEAIQNGEAIPDDMCPPGYYGPTFNGRGRKKATASED